MNTDFKWAEDLVGKTVRRTQPSTKGDYSFIHHCCLIKSVDDKWIRVKTLEGHLVGLSSAEYNDQSWIETQHSVASTELVQMWAEIKRLKKLARVPASQPRLCTEAFEALQAETERFFKTNTFHPMEVTNFYAQARIVMTDYKAMKKVLDDAGRT